MVDVDGGVVRWFTVRSRTWRRIMVRASSGQTAMAAASLRWRRAGENDLVDESWESSENEIAMHRRGVAVMT